MRLMATGTDHIVAVSAVNATRSVRPIFNVCLRLLVGVVVQCLVKLQLLHIFSELELQVLRNVLHLNARTDLFGTALAGPVCCQ